MLILSQIFSLIFFYLLSQVSANFLPRSTPLTIGIISTLRSTKSPAYSYIKESYAEFIQFGDSSVTIIPIPWDLEQEKFDTLLDSVNGVVLPGGDAAFWEIDSQGNRVLTAFQERLNYVVDFVKRKKDEGVHFPLWAICQGMEAVGIAISQDLHVLDNYEQFGKLATVEFTSEAKDSRMFRYFTEDSFKILRENPTMFYYHEFGLNTSVPTLYPSFNYNKWLVTATSKDDNGKVYLTAMESTQYPIFMHMFHAERVLWEANHLADSKHYTGTIYAIKLLAKSFLAEAMRNMNTFEDKKLLKALEIENFEKEDAYYVFNSGSFEQKWAEAVQSSSGFLIVLLVIGGSVGLYYGYQNYTDKKKKYGGETESLIDNDIPLVNM